MRIGLPVNKPWPFDQMMASMMMVSANDAAYAIAERTAGNIADFVTRWGAAYDHMIVLDADSLVQAVLRANADLPWLPDDYLVARIDVHTGGAVGDIERRHCRVHEDRPDRAVDAGAEAARLGEEHFVQAVHGAHGARGFGGFLPADHHGAGQRRDRPR